jgi:MazG family protein
MLNWSKEFDRLVEVVMALRHPTTGCPWDLEQTNASLVRYLTEESAELVAAIDREDWPDVQDELGDVLLQVLLHAEICRQDGRFSIGEVIKGLTEKMIRRHPHVFARDRGTGLSTEQVVENWGQIKRAEAKRSSAAADALGVQTALPALLRALKIGEKSAKVQFDWASAPEVLAVCESELREVQEEMQAPSHLHSPDRVRAEIGDLLFSVVQLARHLRVDPDHALREANDRFGVRYQKMLELAQSEGLDRAAFESLPAAQKERFWSAAKRSLEAERGRP